MRMLPPQDAIANAAKHRRTEEVTKFSGNNLSAAYAAASFGSWLKQTTTVQPPQEDAIPTTVQPPQEDATAAARAAAAGDM